MGSLARMCEAERFIDQFGDDFKEEANGMFAIGETDWEAMGVELFYDDMNGKVDKCLVVRNEHGETMELCLWPVYYTDNMANSFDLCEDVKRQLPHLDEAIIQERMERVLNPPRD
jgi:hypothetical protein